MILIALLSMTKRDGITITTITASCLLSKRFEKVIATDLSPNMIEVAKQRSRQFSNIDFQVADVMQWESTAEQFDVIVSIATLHHLLVETLLPNLKSALKPGGRLIILDLHINRQNSNKAPAGWLYCN